MATGTMGGCDPVVFEMAGCLFRVGGGSPEVPRLLMRSRAFLTRARLRALSPMSSWRSSAANRVLCGRDTGKLND